MRPSLEMILLRDKAEITKIAADEESRFPALSAVGLNRGRAESRHSQSSRDCARPRALGSIGNPHVGRYFACASAAQART